MNEKPCLQRGLTAAYILYISQPGSDSCLAAHSSRAA